MKTHIFAFGLRGVIRHLLLLLHQLVQSFEELYTLLQTEDRNMASDVNVDVEKDKRSAINQLWLDILLFLYFMALELFT